MPWPLTQHEVDVTHKLGFQELFLKIIWIILENRRQEDFGLETKRIKVDSSMEGGPESWSYPNHSDDKH